MNIGGTISKLERNLGKIGMLAGGYATLNSLTDAFGGDAFAVGQFLLKRVMEDPHIPNIGEVIKALTDEGRFEGKIFMPAAKAAVIGYVLKEINLHPTLNRLGKAMMNGGIGIAKGAAIVTGITYAGAARSPLPSANLGGAHSSGGNSETWRYQA